MKYKYLFWLLIAFAFFCFAYNPSHLYFLSDDFDSMYASLRWDYILHSYRFTSDFLLWTDHWMWENNAIGYHITNLLFHFASTVLMFLVTRRLLKQYQPDENSRNLQAFFTSLLFLFYAYHSESLFWIVGRASILAGFFILGSLYFYLLKEKGRVYYFLSLLFFACGLFSYESTWIFPLLIMWLAFVRSNRVDIKKQLLNSLGYWIVFAGYLVARFYLTDTVIGTPYGTETIVTYSIPSLVKNYVALISRSFQPPLASAVLYTVCFVLLVALFAFVFIKTKKKWGPLTYILCVMFLISLLPVVTLGINTHNTESERYLYLPSIFLCILVVQAIVYLFEYRVRIAFSVLLILNITLLFYNYKIFETASLISRKSIEGMKELNATDTLFCVRLPLQYQGGFIFRNGFESATKLYNPQIKNVVFLSKSEIDPNLHDEYQIEHKRLEENNPYRIQMNTTPLYGKAVFNWTEKALEIYK